MNDIILALRSAKMRGWWRLWLVASIGWSLWAAYHCEWHLTAHKQLHSVSFAWPSSMAALEFAGSGRQISAAEAKRRADLEDRKNLDLGWSIANRERHSCWGAIDSIPLEDEYVWSCQSTEGAARRIAGNVVYIVSAPIFVPVGILLLFLLSRWLIEGFRKPTE